MSGVVEKVGEDVKNWKEGDRVMALLPGGGYAQFCVVPAGMLMPIPDNLSFEQAAAIPEVWLTAYQALVWLGKIEEKENLVSGGGVSRVQCSLVYLDYSRWSEWCWY